MSVEVKEALISDEGANTGVEEHHHYYGKAGKGSKGSAYYYVYGKSGKGGNGSKGEYENGDGHYAEPEVEPELAGNSGSGDW